MFAAHVLTPLYFSLSSILRGSHEAPIRDVAIKRLCQNILSSQQVEIDQMKAMLGEKRN